MNPIVVALVGAGYAGFLHMNAYKKVYGLDVRVKTVVDMDLDKAKEFAKRYEIEKYSNNMDDIFSDLEIDVIDIVTPPVTHLEIARKALQSGKHVICEKPLSGYFGEENDKKPIGIYVPKSKMFENVMGQIDEFKKTVEDSGKLFMYAENYIYCPSVSKSAEIISKKKSKILFMKGEESLRGSSSPFAGRWDKTGGGSFIRVGTHPLTGVLYLKQVEAQARGEEISVVSVSADMGNTAKSLNEYDRRHLTLETVDVEDFANVTLTFSDGTKAIVIGADNVLGGSKNYIEIYTNDSSMICNITPANNLSSYFLDQDNLEDVEISEMLPEKTGWNNVFISDEVLRGYTSEMQDFMECIAYDRQPKSDINMAYETTKIIYAAYQSAEENRRIDI